MKILIIEDDMYIRDFLGTEFEKWDFNVAKVENFHNTIDVFIEEKPNLVLMDIKLPVYDGYYFTRKIREISEVPIIFISSKSDNMNQIMAIEMGADDFIIKPFEINLIISKIKALLRRTYTYINDEMKLEKINYDELKLEVSYGEKFIELTRIENVLLGSLLSNKNQYISRNELMEKCWQGDDYIDDNTLFVNISRLRKKFASIGLENVIETKKNVGYRFNEDRI